MIDYIHATSREFSILKLKLEIRVGGWNSAIGFMHTSACIDIFSSPARHSLIAMEPTILQIPIYALTTFHTVEEKVIPFPCKLVIWYRW